MTITRYDFTDTGLEPTGQGEWVRYADYASQLEAANLRHAAALEAIGRARDAALVEVESVEPLHRRWISRAAIQALRTQPTPSVEPVTHDIDDILNDVANAAIDRAADAPEWSENSSVMVPLSISTLRKALRAIAGGRNE